MWLIYRIAFLLETSSMHKQASWALPVWAQPFGRQAKKQNILFEDQKHSGKAVHEHM